MALGKNKEIAPPPPPSSAQTYLCDVIQELGTKQSSIRFFVVIAFLTIEK